ncbi:hypothetical protein CLCR_07792 [Cladophialophora carrionii]|uniref:Uncharacterized protein n=1 Tax=Cladophialophora carrionii TaxID=86049 RepID=A0A1C1CM64_9EURO|nr:hypothetical protein CLCR_07792 [Cladophialophora carrionii]
MLRTGNLEASGALIPGPEDLSIRNAEDQPEKWFGHLVKHCGLLGGDLLTGMEILRATDDVFAVIAAAALPRKRNPRTAMLLGLHPPADVFVEVAREAGGKGVL